MRSFSSLAYGALLLALIAWGALLWGSSALISNAQTRAQSAANQEQIAAKKSYTARLAALAQDTRDQRAVLESLVHPDVVTIVNGIESSAQSIGVPAQVTSALPEGEPTDLPGGGKVQAIGFVVEAHGSFSNMLKTAALFEKLPIASTVESIDLEKAAPDGATASSWHLTAKIRVFTSAPISS
jgi:hypothetical protein